VVTVLRGRVEDIALPVPTVDIVISEWMGYVAPPPFVNRDVIMNNSLC
jgi:hypothetical protein